MKRMSIASAVLGLAISMIFHPAIACESMGPNTHVGMITAVDNDAKTFTIQDAETNLPITFEVNNTQLLELESLNSKQVIVGYAEVDGKLIASKIK